MPRPPAIPPRVRLLAGLTLFALCAPAGALVAQDVMPGVPDPVTRPKARRSLDAAVRVTAGTLGVGAEVAKLLTGHLAARVGANVFAYSRTQGFDDVTYDGRVRLRSASVLLDLYPARRGSFHLTGGAIVGGSEITGTGVPDGETFYVDGTPYSSAEVGTLTAAVRFPRARPYAGLGWGTPANNGGSVRLVLDLGVAFGKPEVTLRASNAAAGDALAADLAEQQASLQQDADTYLRLYPVLSTGLSVRF